MCIDVGVANASLAPSYTCFSQKASVPPPLSPVSSDMYPRTLPPSPPQEIGELDWKTWLDTSIHSPTPPPEEPVEPKKPLTWVWQCHLCRTRYPLGVTRRCLLDGHYYCSGEEVQRNLKKKRGLACSSEYDYIGWKDFGEWRKEVSSTRMTIPVPARKDGRDCWNNCEFPSACRYSSVTFSGKEATGAIAASDIPPSWSSQSSASKTTSSSTVRNTVCTAASASEPSSDSTSAIVNDRVTFDTMLTASSSCAETRTLDTKLCSGSRQEKKVRRSARRRGGGGAAAAVREENEVEGKSATRAPKPDPHGPRPPSLLETMVRSAERRSATIKALLTPIDETTEVEEGGDAGSHQNSQLMAQYIMPVIDFCSGKSE